MSTTIKEGAKENKNNLADGHKNKAQSPSKHLEGWLASSAGFFCVFPSY